MSGWRRWPALVMVAGFAANALFLALLAAWTPLSGSDWDGTLWAARHADASSLAVVAAHATFAKLVSYGLVRMPMLHVIGTPVAATLVIALAFAFARRRLPVATWCDALDLLVLSTLLWVGQPRFGLLLCYRPYAATFVWGGAVTLAVTLPYRCGWAVHGGWRVALVVAAVAAGASAPQLALPAIVYVAIVARATRRTTGTAPRWMWLGLAGLVAGFALAAAQPPYMEIGKVFVRGLEPNFGQMLMPLREAGELMALVAMLALVAGVARPAALAAAPATDETDELVEIPRRIAAWFALAVVALFGPHYSEATLLPATVVLAIAAVPLVRMLARDRVLRAMVVVVAVGIHASTWVSGLVLYHRIGGEAASRMAAVAAAPPGTVAVVEPYSELRPGFWFFGEDWQAASTRQLLAFEVFGLADIEVRPGFRALERNPHVAVTLVGATGATPLELAAARPPAQWPQDLGAARIAFAEFGARLAEIAPAASVRLAATELGRDVPGGRPVEVGWVDHGDVHVPRVRRAGPDPQDRFAITFDDRLAATYPEAWLVGPSGTERVDDADGKVTIAPMTVGRWALIACNSQRCLAVDAFVLDL